MKCEWLLFTLPSFAEAFSLDSILSSQSQLMKSERSVDLKRKEIYTKPSDTSPVKKNSVISTSVSR